MTDPKLTPARAYVLEALTKLGQGTIHDVSRLTGWPFHRISGRLTELREYGFIKWVARKRVDGYECDVYCVVSEKQLEMFRRVA